MSSSLASSDIFSSGVRVKVSDSAEVSLINSGLLLYCNENLEFTSSFVSDVFPNCVPQMVCLTGVSTCSKLAVGAFGSGRAVSPGCCTVFATVKFLSSGMLLKLCFCLSEWFEIDTMISTYNKEITLTLGIVQNGPVLLVSGTASQGIQLSVPN